MVNSPSVNMETTILIPFSEQRYRFLFLVSKGVTYTYQLTCQKFYYVGTFYRIPVSYKIILLVKFQSQHQETLSQCDGD